MSSQVSQLKRVLLIAILVSVYALACVLAWLIGESLGLGPAELVVVIALILLTWPLGYLLIHFLKKKKSASSEAASAGVPARAPGELERSAEEAVQWLRTSRLGTDGDAVYGLPWFLVAGPVGSGKTSLLLSAALDFYALPSQRRADMNLVRPTADCDWRVTNSAVFLDTSGRYQTEGPEREEWSALIETVKKYRRNRPLDGFVIAISAEQIVNSQDPGIEQQAKLLRTRLDEAIARTRTRFPVYLVFTHCESIEGFGEFFAPLDQSERGQVWGATIPLQQSSNAHALFDAEFDLLTEALKRRRLLRLSKPAPSHEQLRCFDLPIRFADTRRKLGLFTSAVFRPNPFSESPLLRGFYFTSSVGDPRAGSPGEPALIKDGFFAERLVKEVLLRDGGLAASFQAGKEHPHRLRNFLLGVAAVLVFLLTVGVFVSFIGNKLLLADAFDRGDRVNVITRADAGKDVSTKDPVAARAELEAVDSLRELLVKLDDYERNSPPLHLRFGLYVGDSVAKSLRPIYFEAVDRRFIKPTWASLEEDLKSVSTESTVAPASDGSPAGDELGRYYDLLKTYLMLSYPEKVEPAFLSNRLAEYWRRASPLEMELISQQQLEFYARQAGRDDGTVPHIPRDDRTVAAARRKLETYPAIRRYYTSLITETDAKVPDVTLNKVLQDRGRGVLGGSFTVPGSYTIDGYREHMADSIESAADVISKDDWVMGSEARIQSTDVGKLKEMYLRDYTDQWRRFLRGIKVTEYKGKDDAVEALKELSDSDSPMSLVMIEVARQTNLSAPPEGGGIVGWFKRLFSRKTGTAGGSTEVEREFGPLFRFVASEGNKETSPLSQYRAELRTVLGTLELASADQLAQTSRTILTGKDDLGLQKAEVNVSKLHDAFKTAAAKDAAALLQQPLGNLRAMLYGGGYAQVERAWREQIYPRARGLESGFPFTDSGSNEASVTDLARFFNPANGQFTQFFNEKLSASFEDVQGQWRLKESGAFKFSDGFVNYLNAARRMRDALFANGGQQPEVSYQITLQPVAGSDVVIEIDGTRVETRGTSPQSAKFIWPARAGSSGARIVVVPASGTASEKPYPGEWGLLRMFIGGGASKIGENQYALSWNVGGTPVRATLAPSSTTNPFQRTVFTQLRAPQGLRD
jgi:type VI secretion system protein ImpL